MKPILDPRDGDLEDDASSTHQRSLLSLAGSLFGEISLPKLFVVWILLLVVPALVLGAAPLLATAWAIAVWSKTANVLTEIWPALLLPPLVAIGWFGGHRLLRLAESSFWSLNALAVQPVYIVCREGLRHLVESPLPTVLQPSWRAAIRAVCAAVAGIVVFLLGAGLIALLWPATRWVSRFPDLAPVHGMVPVLLANSVALIAAYCAGAALVWGIGDAMMAQPRDLQDFAEPESNERTWRVAHLSDIHTVGERYGFRIESGRAGPRGNDRLGQTLARLNEIHQQQALDFVLITGDLTDAGRSAEWAEFLIAVSAYPHLADRIIALPGNHDVNVVDRSSPARMDMPMSPTKRLRHLRTLSILEYLQGRRLRVVSGATLGNLLTDELRPHVSDMTSFADRGSPRRLSYAVEAVWDAAFPMILPPDTPDGLGIVALNSNADTHFSFTNALGLIPAEQVKRLRVATSLYPQACWIIALHHHVIEYPRKAQKLSLRIGTALINGSWVIRQLQCHAGRAVIMHGHRHIDWIGQCGGLVVVSAPSPVMASRTPYFYIHTLAAGANGQLKLRQAQRIGIDA